MWSLLSERNEGLTNVNGGAVASNFGVLMSSGGPCMPGGF